MQSPVPQVMPASHVTDVQRAFREGRPGAGSQYLHARQYADSLSRGDASPTPGCYRCRGCSGACDVCPTCIYLCPCGPDCLYGVWCCLGMILPYSCMATLCACERDGNAYITRDKGRKTGEALLVDKELGTVAFYWVDVRTEPGYDMTISLDKQPFCYIEKRGAPC